MSVWLRVFMTSMLLLSYLFPFGLFNHNAVADTSTIIIQNDFEDGTTQDWEPRFGDEVISVTTADQHSGNYSLLTTNRVNEYDGPSLNVLNKIDKGSKYDISVWVKLAPGEASSNVQVSIERQFQGTTNYETVVGATLVTASEWVNLTGSYRLGFDVDFLSVYVETASGTASFYIDDFTLTFVPPMPIQQDIPSLKDVLADYFTVGAAMDPAETLGVYAELVQKHYNVIVAGDALKWDTLRPSESQFDFTQSDLIVQFAKDNDMAIRGHTLVWHNQTPDWVFQDENGDEMQPTSENKALLLQRLETHIRTVVGRYKDDIDTWDVVNEPVDENQPDCLRQSLWYQITGTDYIKTAFRIAREVDPDAKLFINEFDTTVPSKRTCLYNLTRDLLEQGVPIDGVGHQMHTNIESPTGDETDATIQLFAGLGVDQQITEFDMSVYTNDTDTYTTVPEELLIKQGYRYKEIFDVLKQHKDNISTVIFWGVGDDNTWLKTFPITRLDLPLPFDEQLQAKHAYWGIVDSWLPSPTPIPTTTATPAPTASPTPEPTVTATLPTTPTPGHCIPSSIVADPTDLEIPTKESATMTVTIIGEGGCPVIGQFVKAKIGSADKGRIKIEQKEKTTDANGQAAFTITAKKKTGNANVTFKAGGLKTKVKVKIVN